MSNGRDSGLVDLVQRAREGDSEARDHLFDAYRNYLSVVARAQVGSWLRTKVDPSDLVQQTLLEAHRDFARFKGKTEQEWIAWLRRILSHNATDFARRFHAAKKRQQNREVPLVDGSGGQEPADSGETPSRQVIRAETQREVADALSRLSPDHQEVIMLRNLQRLPFDEVARQMNRTRPAAQMLWLRAIKKLQQALT